MTKHDQNTTLVFYGIIAVCAYMSFRNLWIVALIGPFAFVVIECILRLTAINELLEKILDELKKQKGGNQHD